LDEISELLGFTSRAWINEFLIFHIDHVLSVGRKMAAEMVLKHEEFLFQEVLGSDSLLSLDGLFPHPHELPLLEFLEEIKLLDVVV